LPTRIAINGFGRIGRLALRALLDRASPTSPAPLESALEVVHINELKGGAKAAAHLVEFDSVHGRWNRHIEAQDSSIQIDSARLGFSSAASPGDVAWDSLGVDIVLECSGKFRTTDTLEPYFRRGVRKVIVAAPVPQGALNIVMGINDHLYKPNEHHLLTAASCTTNCLAPVVKVIHETFGIRHGVITTVHDATNTQMVVDAPHKDLRRARSTLMSLIPTSTGSATAIGLIYPELQGKLNGIAVRVPLLNASLTDCVFEVSRPTTVEEVNNALAAAARGPLKNILGFETRPLVSVDYVNDPRSGIVDALSTMVIDGTQVKLLVWYDNEFGYAHRLVELAAKVAARLS
jgi:glyceraldehyde 3-phosphate dehydrogenase